MAGWLSNYDIAFAGTYGVGKTTMFEFLKWIRCNETTYDGTTVTKCIDKWTHRTACVAGGELKTVTLWDTGGMERSSVLSMTKSYFIQTIGFILVYDTGKYDTLTKLKDWYQRATDESTTTNSLVFSLWGNRTDNNITPVDSDTAKAYALTIDVPTDLIFEVNAMNGWNVEESYQKVLEAVHRAQTRGPSPMSFPSPVPQPTGFLTSFAAMVQETFGQTVPTLPETVTASQPPPSSSERYTDFPNIVPREEDTEKNEKDSQKCRC